MYSFADNQHNDRNLLLCVNSDDPGVFQTNTANELGISYMGLIQQGISREACLDWLDRVRESGLKSSFIKQDDSDDVLLYELNTLLDALGVN